MKKEQLELIRKLALQNAVKHDGKANPGAVVGGLLGDFPELKKDMKSAMKEINTIVKEINSLDEKTQTEQLLKIDPSALEKKEHVVDIFGFLNIKDNEKVKTAFPPGPEKHPHIGHAKALLINYELAKRNKGEFILRFEDTNPELVKEEFYQIMQDDFKWLGVKWDKLIYASDHMELYYKHCEELIKKGLAYVSTSASEKLKEMRETGEPVPERNSTPEDNLKLWKEMPNMKKGEAAVLLKIDLKHKNSTMRDPVIFRISDAEHARQKSKYRVWPNYDFQNAIMDGFLGITHRLRSKEFEMRNELQRYIQNLLGYKETSIYEFARFNLEGVESSGRIIREKIQNKELLGWDDPSLTTLAALRRRGFQPEAIKEFVLSTGITKSESTLTWDDLIVHNKRVLDSESERYFFVQNPSEILIAGAPDKNFELHLHPTKKSGGRPFSTNEKFLITEKDKKSIKPSSLYRLIECLNFKDFKYVDDSIQTFKKDGAGMFHFLPKDAENIPVSVLMPDKSLIEGLAETNISKIKEGDIIQFERFGFCRLDNKAKMEFWFTH